MSTYYPPYKSSSQNIKVELDLANYATKTDLKNITHVDVSSYASKTNLAALKSEVDKIDVDKLKTTPADLAKLSNVVKNDVVKKTDYSTKVTSIEAQIAGLTKNTVDNLADIRKLLLNSTEVENKIKSADIIAKSANTKVNTIRSDLNGYAKKADVATDITAIKNDYVTNASLTGRLNDLKSQHIATEVTGIDNKTKKNASNILALENKFIQKEDTINQNERGLSIFRGFFFYLQQNHLVYECTVDSFFFNNKKILKWKSTGIFNYSDYYSMKSIENTKKEMPILKNDERLYVYLQGNLFNKIMY